MLHLSEFSGPDAHLAKSTEDCCAEPCTELSRLSARDAPATAGYSGGKERGRGCSDGCAARGCTVPENRQELGRWTCGGRGGKRFGGTGVRTAIPTPSGPPAPPQEPVRVSRRPFACARVFCVCMFVCASGAYVGFGWIRCAKGTLYVLVRTKGFVD